MSHYILTIIIFIIIIYYPSTGLQCPFGTVYSTCVNPCPPTCDDPNRTPCPGGEFCREGCECPAGRIPQGDSCIIPEECGCVFAGIYYEVRVLRCLTRSLLFSPIKHMIVILCDYNCTIIIVKFQVKQMLCLEDERMWYTKYSALYFGMRRRHAQASNFIIFTISHFKRHRGHLLGTKAIPRIRRYKT